MTGNTEWNLIRVRCLVELSFQPRLELMAQRTDRLMSSLSHRFDC